MRGLVSTFSIALLCGSTLWCSSAQAQSAADHGLHTSGSVLLISDYLYRGISQTDQGPALQGSLTITTDSGWYANLWGSNIKFGQGSMELDLSVGRSLALSTDWTLDLGLMQYRYPKGDNSAEQVNFIEGYGKLLYQDWTFGLALTDDYFGSNVGKFWYVSADWDQQLSEQLKLQWHLGYNKFADALEFNNFLVSTTAKTAGYTDWGVKLVTSQLGLNWTVGYAGTAVDKVACPQLCDYRWLISLGKNF